MSDPKVMEPRFTESQNRLSDLERRVRKEPGVMVVDTSKGDQTVLIEALRRVGGGVEIVGIARAEKGSDLEKRIIEQAGPSYSWEGMEDPALKVIEKARQYFQLIDQNPPEDMPNWDIHFQLRDALAAYDKAMGKV